MADQHGCVTAQVTSSLPSCSAGIHRHTPPHQSSITNSNSSSSSSTPTQQPPSSASTRPPGWGAVRTRPLRPSGMACCTKFSVSTMQLDGASGLPAARDSANASRNWLQRASAHYDGICLARWRRISVALRGRFCMLPEPRGTPLSPIWVVIAAATVSVIWPAGRCPTGSSPKPPFAIEL